MKNERIDPHVHCRDGNERHKETIKHVFEIAEQQGVEKIFDMPNTKPPILREEDVLKRLTLVPEERRNDYFLYIGALADEHQLSEAVRCYEKYHEVIGLKMYAGPTTGDLQISELKKQEMIYQILAKLSYTGVLAVHCEKKELLKPELWNPKQPITHAYARAKEAEIESVRDQIRLSEETGFNGILHIAHISCPESVELVDEARKNTRITCGATPHHLMWSSNMLATAGLLYKTNPPLRDVDSVNKLRQLLKENKIDWIETDHAPHQVGEKLFPPYESGFPSLYLYKDFVENFLPSIGLTEEQTGRLTFSNIHNIFKNKL